MTMRPPIDMTEATRLTREGRLQEAMALLRGEPAIGPRPDATARRVAPLIDMTPPAPGTGGAWTAPLPGGRDPADVPPALRGLLDGLTRGGLPGGLPRAPGPLGGKPAVTVPPGARWEEHVHAGPAGSRSYKLYVPSGREGQALPLVVMLHGCTQSPDDFAAGTRMNELAEEAGVLVAYPAQTQAANASRCWNWFNAADQERDRGEPAIIAGLTRDVMEACDVAPGRVYVAGLSAGGATAAVMAATYPDLYAAVGVHSGLACGAARDMGSAFAAMRQGGAAAAGRPRTGTPVPTIVFHGDRDATVHPVNGDEVAAQARKGTAQGAEVTRGRSPGGIDFTRSVERDGDGRIFVEQWVLHGAGHAWSGGNAAGSYTDPRGPDASREMLRFFAGHAVPAAPPG